MVEPLKEAVAYHIKKALREARAKRLKALVENTICRAMLGVLLGSVVFFTVPMFAHTWHVITDFWGW